MTYMVRRTAILAAAFMAVVGTVQIGSAPAAVAQQAVQRIPVSAILGRLDQLERDVSTLRRNPTGFGDDVSVRIDQIESELRRLTGLLERLEFETTRRAGDADKRALDLETRLQALESREPQAFAAQPPAPSVQSLVPRLPQPTVNLGGAPAVAFGGPVQVDTPPDLSALPVPIQNQQGVAIAGTGQQLQPNTRISVQNAPLAAQPTPGTFAPIGDPQAQYDAALQLLNRGSFDEAGAALETLVSQHPQHAASGSAKYWLGDMHLRLGRFNEAAKAFLESFRGWPEGPKAPDSLLKLGMTLTGLGQREEACLTFTEFPVRYPNADPNLLRRAEIESQRTQCGG